MKRLRQHFRLVPEAELRPASALFWWACQYLRSWHQRLARPLPEMQQAGSDGSHITAATFAPGLRLRDWRKPE
jgi:hypothetical protein